MYALMAEDEGNFQEMGTGKRKKRIAFFFLKNSIQFKFFNNESVRHAPGFVLEVIFFVFLHVTIST